MTKSRSKKIIQRILTLMNIDTLQITPDCNCGSCEDKKAIIKMAEEHPDELEKIVDESSEEFQKIHQDHDDLIKTKELVILNEDKLIERIRVADDKFLGSVHGFFKKIELN